MKGLWTVFQFELMGFLKKKSFVVSTLLICLIIAIGLSVPTLQDKFFNASRKDESKELKSSQQTYGYINQGITNMENVKENFSLGQLIEASSKDELEERVDSGEFEAGFILEESTKYVYVVKNKQLIDNNPFIFDHALAEAYRISELEKSPAVKCQDKNGNEL
jgi:ABC-2 type transport system permease protein